MWTENPVALMRRFSDEMDRFFEDFGLRRGWLGSRGKQDRELGQSLWSPQIEIFERNNQLTVCVDLPGVKREDLVVEFTGNVLTIQGERKREHEEEREGLYRSERSYGSFTRVIPLPPGAITDSAKASFNNGVLEIVMQAPSTETRHGRRLDISGTEDGKK